MCVLITLFMIVCAHIILKSNQYGVLSTPADLIFPMELIKVLTALEPVVGQWDMLGLHLGLSDSLVDTIERDYHTTLERKKRMVQSWMSTPQLCPSWCSLVKALHKVGLNAAAERISKKYSKCFVTCSYCQCMNSMPVSSYIVLCIVRKTRDGELVDFAHRLQHVYCHSLPHLGSCFPNFKIKPRTMDTRGCLIVSAF